VSPNWKSVAGGDPCDGGVWKDVDSRAKTSLYCWSFGLPMIQALRVSAFLIVLVIAGSYGKRLGFLVFDVSSEGQNPLSRLAVCVRAVFRKNRLE